MTAQPEALTRYLARLIGVISVVICLAILLRPAATIERLMALVEDRAALLVFDFAILSAAIAFSWVTVRQAA